MVPSGIAPVECCWTCTASGSRSGVLCCKRCCVKWRLHEHRYWTCWLSCSGQGTSALWRPYAHQKTLCVQVASTGGAFNSASIWEAQRGMLVDFVQRGRAMQSQGSALYLYAGRHLLLPHGAATLLAARVLLLSLACLLTAHCFGSLLAPVTD